MVENVSARHGTDGRSLRLQTFLTRHGLVASSPICFAAFSFDARSSTNSMITVPKFVLDISEDEIWLRYIYAPVDPVPGVEEIFTQFVNELPQEPVYESQANPVSVAAYMSEQEFCVSVNEAVAMIERGKPLKLLSPVMNAVLLKASICLHYGSPGP